MAGRWALLLLPLLLRSGHLLAQEPPFFATGVNYQQSATPGRIAPEAAVRLPSVQGEVVSPEADSLSNPWSAPTSMTTAEHSSADDRGAGAASPDGLQFGYANGFFIASPLGVQLSDKDSSFLLRFNGRLQMRHTYLASEGPNLDENNFEFERAFLIFTGYIHTRDLAYHIKLDGDSDDTEGLDLLDWFLTYDLGHGLWDGDPGQIGWKVGKWKMPFHRARYESSHQFQLVDRSIASEFFDINRSIGVGLFGRYDLFGRPLNWETALCNGFQTQRLVPGRAGELDDNPAVTTRVFCDVLDEWGTDGESDLSWHESFAVRIGAGYAYSRPDRTEAFSTTRSEFLVPRVTDSGATLASLLPPDVTSFGESLYSLDANFKYRGLAVLSEYYLRSVSDFSGGTVPDLMDHGFMVQAGYFVCPKKLELAARWSRVVGDSGTLGIVEQSADEVAGGATWYLRGNDFKLVFDATHLNGAPIQSSATNIRPGDSGWLLRTQLQILF